MKALQIILLVLGGAVFAGILIATSHSGSTSRSATVETNGVAAAPDDRAEPAQVPASPVETQLTLEAARQPANDATPAEVSPATPVPARPEPMPARPRPRLAAQPMHPPLPLAPGVVRQPNSLAALRRLQGDDGFATARERMVAEQLAGPGRGLANPAVLSAIRRVPRHQFVDARCLTNAYVDMTLVVPDGVVLETAYVIAVTADQLAAQPDDRVLDVEPGTAYEAAVFSLLVREVYVTESVSARAEGARVDLERLGYTNNVFVRLADIGQGWPEAAPFDTIVFHGPLAQFSDNLLGQLKAGGRVIIPASDDGKLSVLRKYGARLVLQNALPVRPAPIPGNQVEMHVVPVLLRSPR